MVNQEHRLLRSWKLRIALLLAIITPTIAATGSFYSLKLDAKDREAKMNERVSSLELNSEKQFADKDDLREMRNDIKDIRNQVSDVKDILLRRSSH